MRAWCSIVTAGVSVLMCSGCILPAPHTRVHAFGVAGQVVSSVDRSPVEGVTVVSTREPVVTANGDHLGFFRLPPKRGWHGAWMIGPICHSLLPHWCVTEPGRELCVSAPGYSATNLSVYAGPGGSDHVGAEKSGAYLKIQQLELVPAEPCPSENGRECSSQGDAPSLKQLDSP